MGEDIYRTRALTAITDIATAQHESKVVEYYESFKENMEKFRLNDDNSVLHERTIFGSIENLFLDSATGTSNKKKLLCIVFEFFFFPRTQVVNKPYQFKPFNPSKHIHLIDLFTKILLSENSDLIDKFIGCVEFDDFKYLFLLFTNSFNVENVDKPQLNSFYSNIFNVLIESSFHFDEAYVPNLFYVYNENAAVTKSNLKNAFNSLVKKFLLGDICYKLRRKFLLALPSKIIPFMIKPIFLGDFLSSSFSSSEGLIPLLALRSLFILMTEYNYEYPMFYARLYSLIKPSLLVVNYKTQFFTMLHLFSHSTNMPSYLFASFCKRLARLALVCSPGDCIVLLSIIFDLLKRNPMCQCLVNRTTPEDYSTDPFDNDADDPTYSKASESCLWEIKTLQNHFCYKVSELAFRIDHEFTETDPDEFILEYSDKKLLRDIENDSRGQLYLNFDKMNSVFEFD